VADPIVRRGAARGLSARATEPRAPARVADRATGERAPERSRAGVRRAVAALLVRDVASRVPHEQDCDQRAGRGDDGGTDPDDRAWRVARSERCRRERCNRHAEVAGGLVEPQRQAPPGRPLKGHPAAGWYSLFENPGPCARQIGPAVPGGGWRRLRARRGRQVPQRSASASPPAAPASPCLTAWDRRRCHRPRARTRRWQQWLGVSASAAA